MNGSSLSTSNYSGKHLHAEKERHTVGALQTYVFVSAGA
jgi:hypothetical protein